MEARLVVLVFCFSLAWIASAQQTPENEGSKIAYRAGFDYFGIQDYQRALEQFQIAYDLSKNPAILFNIAQCYRLLGQTQDALTYYERYLKESSEDSELTIREQSKEFIRELSSETPKSKPTAPTSSPIPAAIRTQEDERYLSFLISVGGIAGTLGGGSADPNNLGAEIELEGISSPPEVVVSAEFAYYATPKFTTGFISLVQVTGTSGELDQKELPKLMGGLRIRYFYLDKKSFAPFFAGDIGFGAFVWRFPLEFQGQVLGRGSAHNRGPFVGAGLGFEQALGGRYAFTCALSLRGYLVINPVVEGSPRAPVMQLNLLAGLRIRE